MTTAKRAPPKMSTEVPQTFVARRMLTEAQVLEIIPLSRTTLYRLEKARRFPKSTYISPNRRVWYEDEIVAWQNAVDEFDPHRARGKGRRVRPTAAVGGKPNTP